MLFIVYDGILLYTIIVQNDRMLDSTIKYYQMLFIVAQKCKMRTKKLQNYSVSLPVWIIKVTKLLTILVLGSLTSY